MRLKKIGMRTVKTATAVALTIFIAQLLNLQSPFFAGIAAIIAMQASVSESLDMAKTRIYSTVIGAIIALIFTYISPIENPLFIGTGIFIIIYICNVLELKESISLATIVFLSIILNYQEGSRTAYALHRTLDTFIGLIIGTLINYFIYPPKMEDKLVHSINNMYLKFQSAIENIIWQSEDPSLESLRKDLVHIEEYHSLFEKEARLNLSKYDTPHTFEYIFELLENIYNHISIIYSINTVPYIDEYNKKSLEKLFKKKIPPQGKRRNSRADLIYNYHLKRVLDKLMIANQIINDDSGLKNNKNKQKGIIK